MYFTEYDTRHAAYAVIVDDADRVLLTWFNGKGGADPAWLLPGGGVEYDESLEEAVRREVLEETGYAVAVGAPLTTHSFTGSESRHTGRPFKSVRVFFAATIVGGALGTTEVGGSTDFAEWIPVADVASQAARADIVDIGLAAATDKAHG